MKKTRGVVYSRYGEPHGTVSRTLPGFANKRDDSGFSVAFASIFLVVGLLARSGEAAALGLLFLSFPLIGSIKSGLDRWLWLRRSVVGDAVVVGRKHIEADDTAAYYFSPRYAITHDEEWILEINPTSAQSASDPDVKRVQLKVDETQYCLYHENDSVKIHYLASAPFVFLLEDEV